MVTEYPTQGEGQHKSEDGWVRLGTFVGSSTRSETSRAKRVRVIVGGKVLVWESRQYEECSSAVYPG